METALDLGNVGALFVAMAVLAAVPSVSVLAVAARSAGHGFLHGAATALGVVTGDIVFVLLAVFGLVLLVENLGGTFSLVRYAGGAYLIWLGARLWRSRSRTAHGPDSADPSLLSGFTSGLLITLADQKAVLFYLGFFPAFVDLSALTPVDVAIIVAITLLAVGGVKLIYAYAAQRAGTLLGGRTSTTLNTIAACIMILAGAIVILRT